MKIRRVVTGHDDDGRAVVVSDGPAPRAHEFVHVPGMASTMLWATPGGSGALDEDPTPSVRSQVPTPDGTCFVIVTFPPDSVLAAPSFDPAAADAEHRVASPGIAERFEPDNPGMHVTPTVDYVIILDGEIWLDLDDGAPVRLVAGDTVIQNTTRHAWRNLSDSPATMAAIQVGVVTASLRGRCLLDRERAQDIAPDLLQAGGDLVLHVAVAVALRGHDDRYRQQRSGRLTHRDRGRADAQRGLFAAVGDPALTDLVEVRRDLLDGRHRVRCVAVERRRQHTQRRMFVIGGEQRLALGTAVQRE
jgi:hypothetical protein